MRGRLADPSFKRTTLSQWIDAKNGLESELGEGRVRANRNYLHLIR